jgi:hypothetical protein
VAVSGRNEPLHASAYLYKMKTWLLLFALCLSVIGCKKSSADDDKEMPVLILTAPVNNSTVTGGSTVQITGNVTDNKNIYMIHVHISDLVTGRLLIDIHRYPNSTTYNLAESFTAVAGTFYQVQVRARDNAANETLVTHQVTAN